MTAINDNFKTLALTIEKNGFGIFQVRKARTYRWRNSYLKLSFEKVKLEMPIKCPSQKHS